MNFRISKIPKNRLYIGRIIGPSSSQKEKIDLTHLSYITYVKKKMKRSESFIVVLIQRKTFLEMRRCKVIVRVKSGIACKL